QPSQIGPNGQRPGSGQGRWSRPVDRGRGGHDGHLLVHGPVLPVSAPAGPSGASTFGCHALRSGRVRRHGRRFVIQRVVGAAYTRRDPSPVTFGSSTPLVSRTPPTW